VRAEALAVALADRLVPAQVFAALPVALPIVSRLAASIVPGGVGRVDPAALPKNQRELRALLKLELRKHSPAELAARVGHVRDLAEEWLAEYVRTIDPATLARLDTPEPTPALPVAPVIAEEAAQEGSADAPPADAAE
jgi:hypothetical protein